MEVFEHHSLSTSGLIVRASMPRRSRCSSPHCALLVQALTTYGSEKLSMADAQELLAQIEPDENGLINYVEFVNMSE
jgi:calmodulin